MPDKKRVPGVVDRVEGEIIVIVIKDPDDGENKEVYVKKKSLKRIKLKEGDEVSVEMSQMAAETTNETVSLVFSGVKSSEMAKRFYSYLVDGGLEENLIAMLTGKGVTLEIRDCDNEKLTVFFQCSKVKPTEN